MTQTQTNTSRRALHSARVLLGLLAALVVTPLLAQPTRNMSRAQLEAEAARLEQSGKKNDAAAIRARLKDGDFQVGERVAVRILAATFIADTPVVEKNRTILIKQLPPLSLVGVLRSELQPTVQKHVARFIRDPQVETQSLVQVNVSGEVKNPGFYAVPPEALVSDLVQAAGGPTQGADFGKSEVRRNGRKVIDGKTVRSALTAGQTVEQTRIRPGDELHVGFKPRRDWLNLVQTATFAVSAIVGLRALGAF